MFKKNEKLVDWLDNLSAEVQGNDAKWRIPKTETDEIAGLTADFKRKRVKILSISGKQGRKRVRIPAKEPASVQKGTEASSILWNPGLFCRGIYRIGGQSPAGESYCLGL
jgi:hypothetical protein